MFLREAATAVVPARWQEAIDRPRAFLPRGSADRLMGSNITPQVVARACAPRKLRRIIDAAPYIVYLDRIDLIAATRLVT
jgi:hypothetical protein